VTRTTLRVMLWLASAVALIGFFVIAWQSLSGGIAADPVEVSVLDHATRLANGQMMYAEPSGRGVPLLPGFPVAVSWLVREFDAAAWEPRFVSLLATFLTAIAVGFIVRGETLSWTLGAAAAGLLLMSQGAVTGVAGCARPEPLMLLLVILGCQALRYLTGIFGAVLASMFFSAACFAHPAALVFAIAAMLHLRVHDLRRMVAYTIGVGVLVCGTQLWLSHAFDPWFSYVAWDLGLRAMLFAPGALVQFVGIQLLGTLGVFMLATVLSFALPIPPWRGAVGIWTWMTFAAITAGIITTQAGASPSEALRSTAMILAIVGPVSVQRVTQHLSNWPGGSRLGGHAVVLTALALQFVTLFASGTP
jgi:hypothetical protein